MLDTKRPMCPVCGEDRSVQLPVISPKRSMLSDGQVALAPLRKRSCITCGFAFHHMPPSMTDLRGVFGEEYSLGQRDQAAEQARAALYADAISSVLDDLNVNRRSRIVELGCGMGSLLSHLSQSWDSAFSFGVEPSDQLVDVAQKSATPKLKFQQGFAEDIRVEDTGHFDVCVSVNVIEHTLDPGHFLQVCASLLADEGTAVVICPAAEPPNLELLFFDHISSFTGHAMHLLATRAGLAVHHHATLQGPLDGFQVFVLRRGLSTVPKGEDFSELASARAHFLAAWKGVSKDMANRLAGRDYAIFGTGEYADILATYCPELADGALAYVVDTPPMPRFRDKPVLSVEALSDNKNVVLLAAVHPRSWSAVERRFVDMGRVIMHPLLTRSLANNDVRGQ